MPQWWEDYDPAVDDDRREPYPADEAFEDLDPARDPLSDLVYDAPDDDAVCKNPVDRGIREAALQWTGGRGVQWARGT